MELHSVSEKKPSSVIGSVQDWITAPVSQWPDNRPVNALRIFLRIVFMVVRNSGKDLLMLRAAALTYTVVLSIVPLLALGTAVLKGLGAGDAIREAAYTMIANFETTLTGEYRAVGMDGDSSHVAQQESNASKMGSPVYVKQEQEPEEASPEDGTAAFRSKSNSMIEHLKFAVDKVFAYVDKTNFATLGIVGVGGLLVIVILLLNSVEEAINAIWKPVKPRPFGRRFMDYVAMLIILPLAVNMGFAAIAIIQHQTFIGMAMHWFPFKFLFVLIFRVMPVLIVISTFMLLYRFLPNVKVKMTSALVGGVVGGLIWLIVQLVYLKLQVGVARYNAIYGSFATVPLILVWIYMGWVSFLAGAEVSFAVQTWKRFRFDDRVVLSADMMAAAFDSTAAVFRGFRSGKTVSERFIADTAGVQEADVEVAVQSLKKAGIIREVRDSSVMDEMAFLPGLPSDTLSPARVMKAVCGEPQNESWGAEITRKAIDAAESAIKEEHWPEGC